MIYNNKISGIVRQTTAKLDPKYLPALASPIKIKFPVQLDDQLKEIEFEYLAESGNAVVKFETPVNAKIKVVTIEQIIKMARVLIDFRLI